MLSSPSRILWLLVNLVVGLVPSLAFFAWVERGCALPWIGLQLKWPWILLDVSTPFLALWDVTLILLFGAAHTFFAQTRVHEYLTKRVPGLGPASLRSLYMAITGLSVVLVMGFWQSTGLVLWALPVPQNLAYAISLVTFWSLLAISFFLVSRLDLLEFVGLRQLTRPERAIQRSEGTPRLIQDGIYGVVRHPIYFFTFLAFVAAPVMPLDRMLVFLGSSLYLAFALPIEERKLIALFGRAYEDYQRKVPAIIPFW